jgi:hypothetical protein
MNETTLIAVFEGPFMEASIIKEYLVSNNIQAFIENEHMSNIAPWLASAGGANSAKIIVPKNEYDVSIELIKEFQNS